VNKNLDFAVQRGFLCIESLTPKLSHSKYAKRYTRCFFRRYAVKLKSSNTAQIAECTLPAALILTIVNPFASLTNVQERNSAATGRGSSSPSEDPFSRDSDI
jgi:hypothetical protein